MPAAPGRSKKSWLIGGTVAIVLLAAAIGLGAAVDYLTALGMENVAAHEERLTAYALERLPQEVPGIRIHGPAEPADRAGIVTFTLPEAHAHDVATLLDREAVAIRAGHHCTQPLHERLGETATGRASFNVYSTTEDIDRLAAGLRGVQRIFGRRPATAAARGPVAATLLPELGDLQVAWADRRACRSAVPLVGGLRTPDRRPPRRTRCD